MKTQKKILACIDRSSYASHVTDAASWVARTLQTDLELLHVLDRHPELSDSDDHSGAIGFNAQESLLTELVQKDQQRTQQMRDAGRLFLGELHERAYASGVEQVDIRQRHGEILEAMLAHEPQTLLLVLGRRGEDTDMTNKGIGRHVAQIIRSLRIPILTVTESFNPPRRLLVAFDGTNSTRKCIELIGKMPLFDGLAVHVLMAGGQPAEAQRHLQWAQTFLIKLGFDATTQHTIGDPQTDIHQTIQTQSIDLLVMGAYSHSPIRSLIFGSKTNELLKSANIPSLLVR